MNRLVPYGRPGHLSRARGIDLPAPEVSATMGRIPQSRARRTDAFDCVRCAGILCLAPLPRGCRTARRVQYQSNIDSRVCATIRNVDLPRGPRFRAPGAGGRAGGAREKRDPDARADVAPMYTGGPLSIESDRRAFHGAQIVFDRHALGADRGLLARGRSEERV